MKVYGVLGVIITVLVGALYWQIQRGARLEQDVENWRGMLSDYAGALAKQNMAMERVQTEFQAYRDAEALDLEVFNEHDLQQDLESKPDMVARRATDATDRLFDLAEQVSRGRDLPAPETGRAESTAD